MEFAVQVLDICVYWDDAVDFYTGSSCLQDYLHDLIPPVYADLPGKKKIQTGLQPCKFNSPRTRLSITLGPVSRYLLKKNFTMQCKSAIVKLSFVFFLDELHSMEGLNVCVLVGHHHLFYGCPDNTLHISIPRFPKLLAKQHRTLRQNVSLCIEVEQCNNI